MLKYVTKYYNFVVKVKQNISNRFIRYNNIWEYTR